MKPGKTVLAAFLIVFSVGINIVLADTQSGKPISGKPAISSKDVEGYVIVIESINKKLKEAVAPALKEKNENGDKDNTAAILSAISVLKTDMKTLENEACKAADMEPEKYYETRTRLGQVLAYLALQKGAKDGSKNSPKAFKEEFSQNVDKEIQKLADSLERQRQKNRVLLKRKRLITKS